MVGSVSLGVVARAERPVVLVRAGEQAADEHEMDPAGVPSAAAPFRPVVLGLDIDQADDTLLEFAFDAAARRKTALRIVHAWPEPPTSFYRFMRRRRTLRHPRTRTGHSPEQGGASLAAEVP